MTKLIIKPSTTKHGHKDVFSAGVLVATYRFSRNKEVRDGIATILHAGLITKADGSTVDISNYCYDRDVRRDMAFLIGLDA